MMTHYFRDNRAWVKGLIMGCPFDEPLPDCPLGKIRELPVVYRLKRVNSMTDDEITEIIEHHKRCLEIREMELME